MPIELTIYQVKERLGISIGDTMKLYRDSAFPNAAPNRQARDVKIPIADVEAYEKRLKGKVELDDNAKLGKAVETGEKISQIAILQDAIMARKCGYGDDVAGFLRAEQYQLSERTKLSELNNALVEKQRQLETKEVRLDRMKGELDQRALELSEVEARKEAVEVREEAVERAEDRQSQANLEHYRMSGKVRIMTQAFYDLGKATTELFTLNSGLFSPNNKRIKELRTHISNKIQTAISQYSEGHGISIDEEGKIK